MPVEVVEADEAVDVAEPVRVVESVVDAIVFGWSELFCLSRWCNVLGDVCLCVWYRGETSVEKKA